jgi:YD repeat-containing protein
VAASIRSSMPKGQKTSWQRDAQGRVLSESRDDGIAARALVYENTTGRIKSTTDANGQVATFTYALDDAVLSVVYTSGSVATPSVTFTYDPVYPRTTGITNGTGATAYTYHAPGGLGPIRLDWLPLVVLRLGVSTVTVVVAIMLMRDIRDTLIRLDVEHFERECMVPGLSEALV